MEKDTVKKRRTRIVVKRGNEHLVLQLRDIALICMYARIVFVFDRNGEKYMADKNLRTMLETLDDEHFFRVNRKAIVNVQYVKSYRMIDGFRVKIELTLPDLSADLIVSQLRAPIFKSWIAEETLQPEQMKMGLQDTLSMTDQAGHQVA